MAFLMAAAGGGGDESESESDDENENTGLKSMKMSKIMLNRDSADTTDVYCWFEVTIQDISIPTQTWKASVEVHCFWQDYTLPSVFPKFLTNDFMLDEDCVPIKLSEVFENQLSQGFETPPTYKYLPEFSTVYMSFVMRVNFVERMELERFPLDRQFLNMEFNAWVEQGNWNWLCYEPSRADERLYLDWVPAQWKKPFAVRMVSSITEYDLLPMYINFKRDQPLLLRVRVERRPSYYFGNVIIPNFLIVLGCFTSYAVPMDDVADRLSVTVTLMLTAVAFRYVVEEMLPKVNYLTLMDYYLLAGFIAVTALMAENALAGWDIFDDNWKTAFEWTSGIIFLGIWGFIHFIAVLCAWSPSFLRKTWEQMDKEDSEEEEVWVFADKIEYAPPVSQDEWDKVYKKLGGPEDRAAYYRASHVGPEDEAERVPTESVVGNDSGTQ